MVLVQSQPADGIFVLTLNRPERANALSRALREALTAAIGALARERRCRVLILTGAGETAFCAGLDLGELSGSESGGLREAVSQDVVAALAEFPRPVIGAIGGAAITGGFELALACDVLIASDGARFADTHARMGLLPGWGLSQILPRLIGAGRARWMSFSGAFIDAATAERWGLVLRVVPKALLMDEAVAMAREMAEAEPETLEAMKRLMADGASLPLGEALALERARSDEWNGAVTAEAIAARRARVQARGRARQTGPAGAE